MSEQKEKVYSGLLFSRKAKNSIRASVKINFNCETVNSVFGVPLYSPLITNFEILKYGSNKLRTKLNHIPDLDMSNARLHEPIVKGRNYKPRTATKQV